MSETTTYLSEISKLSPGVYMVLPPDCVPNAVNIACLPREDMAEEIRKAALAGAVVDTIRANGFVCGYRIIIPDKDSGEIISLTQHSGNWGPWYHKSVYRREPSAKSGYVFVENIGGHYSRQRAKDLGLPFGRPDRNDAPFAY